jgi:hypothetical protein
VRSAGLVITARGGPDGEGFPVTGKVKDFWKNKLPALKITYTVLQKALSAGKCLGLPLPDLPDLPDVKLEAKESALYQRELDTVQRLDKALHSSSGGGATPSAALSDLENVLKQQSKVTDALQKTSRA